MGLALLVALEIINQMEVTVRRMALQIIRWILCGEKLF
jgi:hypothetical protein